MSQKISLVKYFLEDGVPIDDTAELIDSTYIPDDFEFFLRQKNILDEVDIKESEGEAPDIPVVFLNKIDDALHEVEVKLAECIKTAYKQVCGDLLIEDEINSIYKDLLIFLRIREILMLKKEKHNEDLSFKFLIG